MFKNRNKKQRANKLKTAKMKKTAFKTTKQANKRHQHQKGLYCSIADLKIDLDDSGVFQKYRHLIITLTSFPLMNGNRVSCESLLCSPNFLE